MRATIGMKARPMTTISFSEETLIPCSEPESAVRTRMPKTMNGTARIASSTRPMMLSVHPLK